MLANIEDQTIVTYSKFIPRNGSFALNFRDGSGEARNAADIFKVMFHGTGTGNGQLRHSTTVQTGSNAWANPTNAATSALIASDLPRDQYYEVWMMCTPNVDGYHLSAFIRYNLNGEEVTHRIAERLHISNLEDPSAARMDWPVFTLYEGNNTAFVDILEYNVFLINTQSPIMVYEIIGDDFTMDMPEEGDDEYMQMSADVFHNDRNMVPVPSPLYRWEIASGPVSGVSISNTGMIQLSPEFTGKYFDVQVSNGFCPPATQRILVGDQTEPVLKIERIRISGIAN
jgi:hypothetical protein